MPWFRVPLAWQNLVADKRRLLISLAGMTFIVVLMFTEFGFRNALLDSCTGVIGRLNGDLYLLSATKYRFIGRDTFPRRRLYQAASVAGVRSAYALYIEQTAHWKNPQNHRSEVIRVLAFDPDEPVFTVPEIDARREDLKQADTALLDSKCRSHLGRYAPGIRTELARQSIELIGTFPIGADFAADGHLVMSDRNFLKYFPEGPRPYRLQRVEIGVLRSAPGADPAALKAALQRELPDDVAVLTRGELMASEYAYWLKRSPIGIMFTIGVTVGCVIGLVISYQILFADLHQLLPQFATLKAMGYGNRFLVRVALGQAFYLSTVGFLPGIALSWQLYLVLAWATGLTMSMTVSVALTILTLTVAMALVSSVLAVQKVLASDPAELF